MAVVADDPATWWSIACMTLFFIVNLIVSLAQLALVAVSDGKLAKLAEDGDKTAARAVKLTERSVRFTETVRLINVILGFAFTASVVLLVRRPLYGALASWMPLVPAVVLGSITVACCVLLSMLVWLLFTELLPRRLAAAHADSMAFALLGFLSGMIALFAPLQWLLSKTADLLSRLFGVDPDAMDDNVTEEEIRLLVDVGEEKGVIEEAQKEMINNIFEFDDLTAADIMTPRIDVEAIEIDDSVDEALRTAVDSGVSRLPVYEEDIDHVVGILCIKDLLPYVGKEVPSVVTVRSMMREPLLVPETKKCGDLFAEMTACHAQMAMVVDEYGGIAGIVTMEDLLESIVGNMQDEYDNEQEEVTRLDENRFEVDGTTDIDEVGELLDITFPEGDYDTLGGFLISKLGKIPSPDDHPQITFENAVFTVCSMDDRRIDSVHIELMPTSETEV